MPGGDGGLGTALVGEKIVVNSRSVAVTKLLGEGGFSYVYLVKELSDTALGQTLHNSAHGETSGTGNSKAEMKRRTGSASGGKEPDKPLMVLKVTSIHSRSQRDIAEKEAKLLSRLSHPSIIKMFDTCYRQVGGSGGGGFLSKDTSTAKPQHIILMEYCEGGHALDVCNKLAAAGKRFDLSTLIIAFGQICNAVSYLHAQRPPIVHRDLKPVNFLVKNGAYKLCDFGSAVFGHVDLRTQKARAEAEEVIEKTTTQMFRAPEMVDLYSAKRLTQATDVWALGCCLFSLAFLQNCFEEGSNLAILSRKYKIPEDNPYGDGLVELLDRMLTVDPKSRSDMTEVILCLSAVYSGRPLPPRKRPAKPKKDEKDSDEARKSNRGDRAADRGDKEARAGGRKKKPEKPAVERAGTYRTDGQGVYGEGDGLGPSEKKEVKKLNPNSAAARRRQQAGAAAAPPAPAPAQAAGADIDFSSFHENFDDQEKTPVVNQEMAFSTAANPFFSSVTSDSAENNVAAQVADGSDIFGAFDNANSNTTPSAANAFASFDAFGDVAGGEKPADSNDGFGEGETAEKERVTPRKTSSNKKVRRPRRKSGGVEGTAEGLENAVDEMNLSSKGEGPETRKVRREKSEGGEKRSSGQKSKGERPRRPKEAIKRKDSSGAPTSS